MTFECDKVTALPENIPSLTAQVNIPGKEGGDVQYLGSPPQQLRIEGIIRGTMSKTVLDKLKAILEIDLMNLPDSLRKTMLIIAKHGETTPEEVAEETNRTRGLENIYLNQLERLGYVEKTKRGKRVYFRSLRII